MRSTEEKKGDEKKVKPDEEKTEKEAEEQRKKSAMTMSTRKIILPKKRMTMRNG